MGRGGLRGVLTLLPPMGDCRGTSLACCLSTPVINSGVGNSRGITTTSPTFNKWGRKSAGPL